MPDKIIASYDPLTGAPIYEDGTRGAAQLTADEIAALTRPTSLEPVCAAAEPSNIENAAEVAAEPVKTESAPEAAETAAERENTQSTVEAVEPESAPAEAAVESAETVRAPDAPESGNDADAPTLGEMLDTLNILMPDYFADDNVSAASPAPDMAVTSSAALTAKAFYDAQGAAIAAEEDAAAQASASPVVPVVSPFAALSGGNSAPQPASPYSGAPRPVSGAQNPAPPRREHEITVPQPEDGDYAPSDCVGFFTRLFAFLLDSLVAGLMALVVSGLVGLIAGSAMDDYVLFSITLKSVIRWLVVALYFVLLTGFTGATLGKRLLRIQVVSPDGARASWWSVIYRETIGRYLSSLLCIGYIVLAFDKRHRGFHDMLADTRVVYCR